MKNRLHIYTGGGKGKTTAAMGLAVRSLGHGNRVLVGQFMKDGSSGELAALARLPGARVHPCPPVRGFFAAQDEPGRAEIIRSQTEYALALLEEMARFDPQTVILDELGAAVQLGAVPEDAAQRLIDAALAHGETVVTGYAVPDALLARADYISRIEAQRHPYETEGLQARRGVEW